MNEGVTVDVGGQVIQTGVVVMVTRGGEDLAMNEVVTVDLAVS
jgi:hypothetical protein